MLDHKEIINRIERLEKLMTETPTDFVCNWEVIAVEKIKRLFEKGLLSGGGHMQVLNKFYKDYKYRKDLEMTDRQSLSYRKWDLLFSEHKDDELMYNLRRDYIYGKDNSILPKPIKNTKLAIQEIKRNLKDLSIKFNETDIMRIRICKKPGDLVMVENPFDDEHQFPAVISSSTISNAGGSAQFRNSIEWYKQSDPSVTGKSIITEYDLVTGNVIPVESLTNVSK